jgi:hypothetical protein
MSALQSFPHRMCGHAETSKGAAGAFLSPSCAVGTSVQSEHALYVIQLFLVLFQKPSLLM